MKKNLLIVCIGVILVLVSVSLASTGSQYTPVKTQAQTKSANTTF